jgi:hypothetical protein
MSVIDEKSTSMTLPYPQVASGVQFQRASKKKKKKVKRFLQFNGKYKQEIIIAIITICVLRYRMGHYQPRMKHNPLSEKSQKKKKTLTIKK